MLEKLSIIFPGLHIPTLQIASAGEGSTIPCTIATTDKAGVIDQLLLQFFS